MASNNIDFVIGAKDQAAPAFSSVEEALARLEQQTGRLSESTSLLTDVTATLAGVWFSLKSAGKIAGVLHSINDAYDEQGDGAAFVAEMSNRVSSSFNDLQVTLGAMLAPFRVLISAGLEAMAYTLNAVLTPAAEAANAILENIGPVIQWVREQVVGSILQIVEAFTFWEVVLTNLDKIWMAAVAQVELYLIQMTEAVAHALTVVIPAYAKWFADNFVNIVNDAFNATIAIVTNFSKIFGEVIYQLFAFIASGGEGGLDQLMADMGRAASMSLLDGFESQLTALPDIAERAITQREKDLAAVVGGVGDDLGKEFNDKFNARAKMIESFVGAEIKGQIDTATEDDKIKGKKTGSGNNTLAASESRLLTRGSASDPMDKTNRILAAIEKQDAENAKIYAQQLEASRAIAANTAGGKTNLVPIA